MKNINILTYPNVQKYLPYQLRYDNIMFILLNIYTPILNTLIFYTYTYTFIRFFTKWPSPTFQRSVDIRELNDKP